jgi:hypothetical protein
MIRFECSPDEKPMSLPDAATYLGGITGQKPHLSTLWRWCLKGCYGVRLESICIGGKRFVTPSAIQRFIENSTSKQTPSTTTVVTITPHAPPHVVRHNERRRAEIEAARRKLNELTGVNKPRGTGPQSPTRSA